MNQTYLDTARLLTQVAPLVFVDGIFALKGGTAINLFIRDLPRLSIDLDLVFIDHSMPRNEALARINEVIRQSAERLKARGFRTHTLSAVDAGETKLLVRRVGIEVKVEVNFVMRGTVNPVRTVALTPIARDTLMADLEIPVVSLEDVYGGKLVAAMDRQHPRDLFDVMPQSLSNARKRLVLLTNGILKQEAQVGLLRSYRGGGGGAARSGRGITVGVGKRSEKRWLSILQ